MADAPHQDDQGLRAAAAKLCLARLDGGGWCLMPDGHEGDHVDQPRVISFVVGGALTKRRNR